jgi:glycosyltransferase involved in cell wall biosynthesis
VKVFQIKNQGSNYIVETNDAKNRVHKHLKINKDLISVVGNTYNSVFDREQTTNLKDADKFKLISVSAYYLHKNLEIINEVVHLLKERKISNIHFYVTLPEEIFNNKFARSTSCITNLGPVLVNQLPEIYSKMNAVFLPTLMETFSASYPEAMKMKLPIITSDLSFANDICDDAAIFVNSCMPDETLAAILKLKSDSMLYDSLVLKGSKRLSSFETAKSRADKYIDVCKTVIT